MRAAWGVAFAVVLLLAGCTPPERSSNRPEVRASIVAGLTSGHAGLTRAQVRTFRADVRSGWAIAYDPADPPGCSPGGMREATPKPCTAYLMQRRKTRWAVVDVGMPGTMFVIDGAPSDLGARAKLGWLTE